MADARKIVFTGAAGGIGTMTRPLLAKLYPGLVLSDRVKPKDLLASESFVAAGRGLGTRSQGGGPGAARRGHRPV